MYNQEYVLENDLHKFLWNFWDTNKSPNLGETTRTSESQQKREPAELWILFPQQTTE